MKLSVKILKYLLSDTVNIKFLIMICFLGLENSYSQDYWQQTNGPTGADISMIYKNSGGDLFAGNHDGEIYRSDNDGVSWRLRADLNVSAEAMVIDPAGNMYIGTTKNGIYRSIDNGLTWEFMNEGLSSLNITTVAVNPFTGRLFSGTGDGLFYSTNQGQSWMESNNGISSPDSVNIQSIYVHSDGTIYLAVRDLRADGGVYFSEDDGITWHQITGDLPGTDVYSVVRNSAGYLFAVVYGDGVYWSINGGSNWERITSGLGSTELRDLYIHTNGYLFVGTNNEGIYRSTNDGGNWERLTVGLRGLKVLTIYGLAEDGIYVGMEFTGIFYSTTAGDSWIPKNGGIIHTAVTDFTITSGGELFTSTADAGIFATNNQGDNWEIRDNGLTDWQVLSLAYTSGRLFAGTLYEGIYRSIDDGNLWKTVNTGITEPFFPIGAIVVDNFGTIIAGSANGIYRSVDNGNNWTNVGGENYVFDMLVNPVDNTIFAGLYLSGILRSTNGGLNWTPVNDGLTDLNVWSLAMIEGNRILAGTEGGLFQSQNNGENWSAMDIGDISPYIRALATNALDHIFIGTNGLGAYVSKDAGASWQEINQGLTNQVITDFTLDSDGYIYAGTERGVFRSTASTLTPSVPVLVSPADQATEIPLTPTLIWEKVPEATSYHLQIALDVTFDNIIRDIPGITDTLEVVSALAAKSTFYWRVRAINQYDSSPWSQIRKFTTFSTFIPVTSGSIVTDNEVSLSASWGDFNGDGYIDVLVTNSGNNSLYQNSVSGEFTKITADIIVIEGGDSRSATWGDYDNDGDPDIFIANTSNESNFLYENRGNGTFNKISSGDIVSANSYSIGSSWGDFDGDGDLDLIVTNSQSEPNYLYKNEGANTFTRVTSGVIALDAAESRGCNWVDYDADGDLDLFIANDEGGNNFLYENNGEGNFSKNATFPIVSDGGNSVGGSWGDYDNDKDLDLFVANRNGENNFLYENMNNAGFRKITVGDIVNDGGDSRGSAWGDYDNDGDLDLFVANIDDEMNFLYENKGEGIFEKITASALVNLISGSVGCAWADYDADGDLDLFVANSDRANFLFRNDLPPKNWLHLKLEGTTSNRMAIGARIYAKANIFGTTTWQTRDITAQSGLHSQNSMIVAFGLGDAAVVDSIVIHWPSGIRWDTTNVSVNNLLTIVEESIELPTALTKEVTSISSTGATLNGTVNPNGLETVVYFTWGTTLEYTNQDTAQESPLTGSGDQTVTAELTALSPNTEYHYRVVAINEHGTVYGSDSIFTTLEAGVLAAPTLNSPANNAQDISLSPTLAWSPVDVGTYWLQVATDPSFNQDVLILDSSKITMTSFIVEGLDFNTVYYWRVNVTQGVNTSPWSGVWIFTTEQYQTQISLNTTKSFPTHDRKDEYKPTDYRIFGIPGNSGLSFIQILGSGAHENWEAYWDNGASSDYLQRYDGSSTFNFEAGKAFWILNNGSLTVNQNISSVSLNENNEAEIHLHNGWNLITDPFLFSVGWAEVQQANLITEPIYQFNGQFSMATVMLPYEGYYFFNNPNDPLAVLRIPYDAKVAKAKPSANEKFEWRVNINLCSDGYEDASTYIGLKKEAEFGIDQYDYRKPRGVGEFAGVYFPRPNWDDAYSQFATDIRPKIREVEKWNFELTAIAHKQSVLTFKGIDQISSDLEIFLVDISKFSFTDLKQNASYSFNPVTDVSKFEIWIGEQGSLTDSLISVLPKTYELGKNFPNPFNPVTSIPVSLPEPANITIKVYNILGQELSTLFEGSLKPGRHFFQWDGRNQSGHKLSSGVYIYRMTTKKGRSFIGKMILLK